MKIISFILLLLPTILYSNPLFNITSENDHIYFLREGSIFIKHDIATIKPLSLNRVFGFSDSVEKLKPFLYIDGDMGIYLKPLNQTDIIVISTSEERTFIEGSSGIKLNRGFNSYIFMDGFFAAGKRSILYYQVKYVANKGGSEQNINRFYGKLRLGKFSFQVGRDNLNLGPGEYGLLLSNNTEPYPLIKIQTEQSINIFGSWDFVFMRGWLLEERNDRDNPSILAIRLVWKPLNFIELGATKTTLYEGEGRPKYRLEEYLELILSTRDNIPGDRYDNSSNAGYDISVYLPLNAIFPSIKVFKVYFQEAASDVIAFWQKEDKGKFYPPFGIKFLSPGYQFGFLLSSEKNIIRFEVAKLTDKFFLHHYYPIEGHTYGGLSLGYPYGRNSLSAFLKHRYYFKNNIYFEYKIGGLKQPFEGSARATERFFMQLVTSYTLNRIKGFIFLRTDKVNNYDINPLPNLYDITDKDKIFYTIGCGLTFII